jgi:hypothetical protein
MNTYISRLHATQLTLRELTILPDTTYGGPFYCWTRAHLRSFTALEILRVPSLALFQQSSGGSLRRNPDRAGFEDRVDIVSFLPPNVQELEMWFRYPSGVFATGERYMQQFKELSEDEQLRGCQWIPALLQLQSLKRVRLTEELCAHLRIRTHSVGGRPISKYAPPDVVSEAFFEAETDLEIELLEVREEDLECDFDH